MKIRTYENSVRHGVIDTLKLEDRVKDISSQVQDSQRIVTAPALSGRRTAGENESAEAVAADNAVNGAKSFAGAFRDFAGNEIKRALKRTPVRTDAANAMRRAVSTGGRTPRGDLNRRTLRVIKGNAGQTVKSHAAGQAVSGAAVRGVERQRCRASALLRKRRLRRGQRQRRRFPLVPVPLQPVQARLCRPLRRQRKRPRSVRSR